MSDGGEIVAGGGEIAASRGWRADGEAPYCPRCGRPEAAGGHERCEARALTDPPRYCADCGRKLAVQVTPFGYRASCVRCG